MTQWGNHQAPHRPEAEPSRVLAAYYDRGGRDAWPVKIGKALLFGAFHSEETADATPDEMAVYKAGLKVSAIELRALASVFFLDWREKLTDEERAALRPMVADLADYLVQFLRDERKPSLWARFIGRRRAVSGT